MKSDGKIDCKRILEKPKRFKLTVSSKPIHYLPTQEGLLSHWRQFEVIWNWVSGVNRTVLIPDFFSHHFGYDRKNIVNLCNEFDFPPNIQCERDPKVVSDAEKCIIVGYPGSWSTEMNQYGYFFTNMNYAREITPVCPHLNIRQVECFGAYLGGWPDFDIERVIYPPPYSKKLIDYSDFSKRYKKSFRM